MNVNDPERIWGILLPAERESLEAARRELLASKIGQCFDVPQVQYEEYFYDGEIVTPTIFSYSEISADEFEKHSKAGTADKKMTSFEAAIKEYSDKIIKFDHAAIFAESELGKRNSVREEELIDQIFRLFRHDLPAAGHKNTAVHLSRCTAAFVFRE